MKMAIEDEQGVYRLEDAPSKPHPHCYCYLTAANLPTLEDLEQALADGKFDTPDNKFSEDPNFNTKLEQIKWKPTMSLEDAKAWASRSVFHGEFLHGTTEQSGASIRSEGFKLDNEVYGRLNGNGVYLTQNDRTVQMYANGDILKAMVDVRDPIELNSIFTDPRYFDATDWVEENLPDLNKVQQAAETINEYLRITGHDAVVKMRGDIIEELIIPDPKKIVVIE